MPFDSGATTKITINNRRLNKADFEQTILIPMAEDGLDKYRKEYNRMLCLIKPREQTPLCRISM